jgi:hypothetical protein
MKRLTDRRRHIAAKLPPFEELLRGSVVVRWLRCGTPGCHCAAGRRHRATYLSVTLAGGRTEQISLPAALVPVVKRWVANYHAWWAALEKVSAINRDLIRHQRRRLAPPRRSPRRSPRKRRPA